MLNPSLVLDSELEFTEQKNSKSKSVSILQLFRYATGWYKISLIFGVLCAFTSGLIFSTQYLAFRDILSDIRGKSKEEVAGNFHLRGFSFFQFLYNFKNLYVNYTNA